MQIILDSAALKPALTELARVALAKGGLPVLASARIEVLDTHVLLLAQDCEVGLAYNFERRFGSTLGVTLAPAAKLLKLVAAGSGDVTITAPDDCGEAIDVICAPFKASLQVLPTSDYPAGSQLDAILRGGFDGTTYTHDNELVFSHAELKGILKRVKFAMAKADVRYYLNGVCFDFGYHQRGAIVTTDGHRLAAEFIRLGDDHYRDPRNDVSAGYIIPENAINHLYRLLSTSVEDKVTAKFSDHVAEFDFGDGSRLVAKCIDGRFPDYMSVIPHKLAGTVTCDTAKFAKLAKSISSFSNERYKGIRLTIERDALTLSAKNPEGDKVTVDMPCTRSGEVTDYEIGFNVNYLLDVLGVINTKEVDLRFNDPNSSCLITPHDVESTQYVIMPMRL